MILGETLSIVVAVSWTATALFSEVATRRVGTLTMNVFRMSLSLLFLGITLWIATGSPYPLYADGETWLWLSLSGFVGYILGDYCLFNSYLIIGSRFGQLFMTLASPFAALAAWVLLGETMSWYALLGMCICITGIGMSILSRSERKTGSKGMEGETSTTTALHEATSHPTVSPKRLTVKLPARGILLGIGAGAGQGIGLVLSKTGMAHYSALVPDSDTVALFMIPFAATMMRAVTGFVGFTFSMAVAHRFYKIPIMLRDKKALGAGIGAVILGPFIGVSLSLMAVQLAPAGVAQTLMSLSPIFILLPSRLLFKTPITWMEVVGAIVAVAGVSLFFV